MSKPVAPLVSLAALLLASVPAPAVAAEQQAITVVDALGRTVNLTKAPSRVVSLAPSITEDLAALGLLDRVVGADSFSLGDWYLNISGTLKARNATDLKGYWWSAINVEAIIGLRPDLVLADAGAHKPLLSTFEQYGLTVVYLKAGSSASVEDVYWDIDLLGKIFNVTDRAAALINAIESSIASGRQLLSRFAGTKLLYVLSIYHGIWVAGRGTFFNDLLGRLGLANAAGAFGWASVGLEQVVAWRPDVVLILFMGATPEDVKSAGLDRVGAKIVFLNQTQTDVLSRPSPIIQLAPQVLAEVLSLALGASATATATPTTTSTTTTPAATPAETTTTTQAPAATTPAATAGPAAAPGAWALAAATAAAFAVGIAAGYALAGRRRRA